MVFPMLQKVCSNASKRSQNLHVCIVVSIWTIPTEYGNGDVAINPKHIKLITALGTAVENGEEMLDKDATSHDSFR